jgi:Cd2+/Zn2+-exporting ATPase
MTDEPRATDQSAGNQGQELTARLAVPDMDCPSCAQKVDKSLGRVDGVTETSLQPTTGTATVTYDPDRASEADVVRAIEAAGYEVVDGRSADSENDESASGVAIAPRSAVWTSTRGKKTWAGAAFVVLGLLFEFILAARNGVVASALDYPLHVADVLFLAAVAASGLPVVRSGYYSAKNRSLDIDLMGDDVGKLPYLYDLSRTANGVIRQNIRASLGVKALLALGVPLGLVSVALAVVVGDMGMSLGVTGNAMRLSRLEPERTE